MMYLRLTLLIMLFSTYLDGQNRSFHWVKTLGANGYDSGNSIATDNFGNIYSTGTFSGTVDFDNGPTVNSLTSLDGGDIYLTKHDSLGNLIWVYHFGSLSLDVGSIVVTDNSNNVYLTGSAGANIDFDPGSSIYSLHQAQGVSTFLLKLDANGNFVFAKEYTASIIEPRALTVDNLNNVYMTGRFRGNNDFSFGGGLDTITSVKLVGWTDDAFVLKLDSMANFKWVRQIGGLGDDCGFSVAVDKYGNVGIGGTIERDANVFSSSGNILIGGTQTRDGFIAKYNINGDLKWAKAFGAGDQDGVNTIAFDKYGNLLVGGYFKTTVDFDSGSGVYNLVSSSNSFDGFLLKIDTSATFIWVKQVGGGGTSYVDEMYINSLNEIFLTINFTGPINFDPAVANYTLTGVGGDNILVTKLDSLGVLMWAKQIGNSINGGSHAYSMAVDRAENIYTIGAFNTDSDFDTDVSLEYKITSVGDWDIFIHKLGKCLTNVVSPISNTSLTQCSNKPSLLKVTGNGSILWYSSATSTIVIGSGPTYTVPTLAPGSYTYYVEAKICATSPRIPITFTVLITPTVTAASSVSIACKGALFQIVASGADTYSWQPGNQINDTAIVTQQIATIYTVSGTSQNGCIGTNTVSVGVYTATPITIVASPSVICAGSQTTLSVSGIASYTWNPGNIIGNNIVVSPTITTNYFVTGTTSYGCPNTSSLTLNVSGSNVSYIINPTIVCAGSTATLTGIGASSTYTWNPGAILGNSIVITPTVSLTYTMNANASSCAITKTISVLVSPKPILTVTGTNTLCLGTSGGFLSTGAMTYTWNTGQTTSSISVNPTSTTIYTVWGSNMDGCVNSQTASIAVNNTCQDVWPGDANSDGVADNLDVLELGLHYTQTGLPRATASNSWQSYFANNWTGTITNGKNLNHSDCNGDGTINDDDTLAIFNNYGLTHTFKPTQPNLVNPQLSIVPDQAIVVKGTWGSASIYLGDATTPVNNINGVAFTVDFDNTLIEPNSIYIEYQNSFIDASQNLHFRKIDFANGKIFTATTHTVSNNVSGFGKIATLHYQILSSLATDQTLNIGVSQANQSDASGAITPLTASTGTLMTIASSVSVKEMALSGNVLISPNPTNGILNISFSTIPQNTKIEVYNTIGALVLAETANNKSNTINLMEFSNGLYFIKVLEGNKVIAVKKVVKE